MVSEFWGTMLILFDILAVAEWWRYCGHEDTHWTRHINAAFRRLFGRN